MNLRLLAAIAVLSLAAVLAACGGGGGGNIIAPATPTPVPPRSGITMLALGDDGIVAIGSSVCDTGATLCPSTTSAPGTPLTLGSNVPVNGFAQIFGRSLALSHSSQTFFFAGLGVRGALTGNAPLPEAGTSGDVVANVDQLTSVPGASA